MTKIKIDPEGLSNTSRKISALKLRVAQLENELIRTGNSAPSYDGQFKPRVLGLTTQAKSQVSQRTTTLDSQAARLERIAKHFLEADNFFIGSKAWWLFLKEIIFNDPSKLLGFLSPKVVSQIRSFLVLGSLFIFPPTNNLTKKLFLIGLINIFSKDSSKPDVERGSVPNSGGNATIEEPKEPKPKQTVFPNNVGESVKPNDGGPAELGYGTYGSNCTWFAAQAALYVSSGAIRINEWGDATKWLGKAKELENDPDSFVEGVDKTPRPGDIIVFEFGHVAYVEKVEGEGMNAKVTFVEEGYGQTKSGWPQGIAITHENGQSLRRWRVTTTLSSLLTDTEKAKENGTAKNTHFIHLKYN